MCVSKICIMQRHYFGNQVQKLIQSWKDSTTNCYVPWIKPLFNVQHTGTYFEAGLGGRPNVQQNSGVLMPGIWTDIPSPWRRGLDRKAADYIPEQCSRVKHGGGKIIPAGIGMVLNLQVHMKKGHCCSLAHNHLYDLQDKYYVLRAGVSQSLADKLLLNFQLASGLDSFN